MDTVPEIEPPDCAQSGRTMNSSPTAARAASCDARMVQVLIIRVSEPFRRVPKSIPTDGTILDSTGT